MELTTSFEGVADEDLAFVLEELELRKRYRSIDFLFPGTGALRRELYAKHLEFFRAGAEYRLRWFLAANRVGKSLASLYEAVLHATGEYPYWWQGKRFEKATTGLIAGVNYALVRDSIQRALLGAVDDLGSGLIPRESLDLGQMTTTLKSSVLIPNIAVKHVSGGTSTILLRSYENGRASLQAMSLDYAVLDEEPRDAEILDELMLRTATTNGIISVAATPLMGITQMLSDFVGEEGFQEGAKPGSKFLVTASWEDVPHLSAETKKSLWDSLPPFQREARAKGVPTMGSGAVYPVSMDSLLVEDFHIEPGRGWVFAVGLDVGWNNTACIVLAKDLASETSYVIKEYKRGELTPAGHAEFLRGGFLPNPDMPVAVDPASQGSSQLDGRKIFDEFRKAGLNVVPAKNGVEGGIMQVLTAMQAGKLKIFKSCSGLLAELRTYQRNTDGTIRKSNDHLCDAMRYALVSEVWSQVDVPKAKSLGGIYRGAW